MSPCRALQSKEIKTHKVVATQVRRARTLPWQRQAQESPGVPRLDEETVVGCARPPLGYEDERQFVREAGLVTEGGVAIMHEFGTFGRLAGQRSSAGAASKASDASRARKQL